jgi:hypothetical protein
VMSMSLMLFLFMIGPLSIGYWSIGQPVNQITRQSVDRTPG